MGKAKKTRKFAVAKKMISPKDTRVKQNSEKAKRKEEELKNKEEPRQIEQAVSAMFFEYNTQLGPPYHVLVDTNFINFSIRKKLDIGASERLGAFPFLRSRFSVLLTRRCLARPPTRSRARHAVRSMMDCLLAKCIPCITDCVMGELEKLGSKYNIEGIRGYFT